MQKPPGELFFISIGDLLTWVDFSVHLRLLPYLRILTSRTRTLGALAACGTERGVSCESNAVSTTSWFDREGILPQQSNPPTAPRQPPHIAARCRGSNFENIQKPIAASVYPSQKPPGALFFISIGDPLTWVEISPHLRLLPYLRFLTGRTRGLGALATCGTDKGVSRESNAVSMTS